MEISVSSGRKIYKRGAGGYYDSTQDSFASQTISLPDDATPAQIVEARFKLFEEMDLAVDLHLFVNGMITRDQLLARKKERKEAYEKVIAVLTNVNA
jgi:hypothetical protein